jgi:hypothetical protein
MENLPTNSVDSDVSTNFLLSVIKSKLDDSNFVQEVKLDSHSIQVINLILDRCPNVIDGLDKHIKSIISDNVVNSADIPAIILLVRDVLNTNLSELKRVKVTRDQVIVFIKNIFIILIEADIIKTSSPESKQAILVLVDGCVKLLESKVNVQKVIRCKFFN